MAERPRGTIARNLYGALAGKVKIGWEFPKERGNKELPKPTRADEEFLDFLYSVCDDVEGGISQWVTDCITRTPFYGYGLWEVVLGLRRKVWKSNGWESQENDDLTGIRSLAFRDYATFQRWHLDDKNGRPTAWEQNDPPNPITPIPLSRCLHIRYGDLSNPEGLAAGDRFDAGRLLVFRPGDPMTITALTPARSWLLALHRRFSPRQS